MLNFGFAALNLKSIEMILKKCVLVLVLLTAAVYAQAQHSDVYDIKFTFQHSMRIPDNLVTVSIERRGNDVTVFVRSIPMEGKDTQWVKTKKEYSFPISLSTFDSIAAAVKAINCSDILNDIGTSGMDGTTCEIKIGGIENGITYKVWTPNYHTKERHLQPFLNACKLILTTGKLDADKILK